MQVGRGRRRVYCHLTIRKWVPDQIPDGYPGTKLPESPSTINYSESSVELGDTDDTMMYCDTKISRYGIFLDYFHRTVAVVTVFLQNISFIIKHCTSVAYGHDLIVLNLICICL